MLVEEDWRELGRKIYNKEESIENRKEELVGMKKVFEKEGMEGRYKAPADGNCFYHSVKIRK